MIISLLPTAILKMINSYSKHILPVVLFAVLATVLVSSWFRAGLLYGGGDVGIPSYDPERIFNIAKFVWWDASAPGTTVPQGLTSVPFQFIQMVLHKLGLSYVLIQASFFWVVIFLMGYGMFLMARTVFGREKTGLALLAGFFYELNPYTMIEVWHRFIHTTFFLAAALPFIFIFWTKWIRDGKFVFLLLFLLTSFLSSYLFGTLAFIVVIIFLLGWVAIVESLFPWKNSGKLKKGLFRFALGIIVWFLIHAWWMLPSFGIAPAVLSVQHSVGGSLSTLLSISEQAIIPYSLFGINPFYVYSNLDFGAIYNSPFFRIIPFFTLIFLIPGFLRSILSRQWAGWGLLFILGLFLSKGAAAPFGNAYLFGFTNIFSLGVLRNPFEKLGILIPFSSAILFSLGVNYYMGKFKNRAVYVLIALSLVLLLGAFQWPVWAGRLFGTIEKPAYVEVPQSYIEADKFIREKKKDGNILHLPLATGEAASYNWNYGYNGVESSQLYFKSLSSISRGFNITHVDDAISALSAIFSVPEAEDNMIISLLQAFNVRFLVLHKDMEWRGGILSDPAVLETTLNLKTFLIKEKTFGNLVVYQLKESNSAPKLRLSENFQYINPGKENSYWPWLIKESPGDLISPADRIPDSNLVNESSELLVVPHAAYSYFDRSAQIKDAVASLAATRILPGSPLYFLVPVKERIMLFSLNQTEKFLYRLTLAGKRLAESYQIKEKKLDVNIVPLLSTYQESILQLKNEILARNASGFEEGNLPLDTIFARHISVLDYLISILEGKEKETARESKRILTDMMKLTNLLPEFEIKENQDLPKSNRLISVFQIPYAGSYEVLMASQNGRNFYKDDLMQMSLQIDDSIVKMSGLLKDSFISYGYLNFTSGLHELGFYSALSENMFSKAGLEKEFEVESEEDEPAFLDFEIEPVTGGGWYQLTFESWIKAGDMFKVQLIQDSDSLDKSGDGRYMAFNKKFTKNQSKTYRNRYTENLNIRPSTKKAKVRFLVEPLSASPSASAFRNIEIKRVLRNPLFLRASLPRREKTKEGILEFKQISPILYTGRVRITNPKFLIFAQSFHPGWELKLNDGTRETSLLPKYMANLYSNAWYIEKGGDYTFSLEFVPQRLVRTGIIISVTGWLVVFGLLFWQRFRKV